MSIYLYIICMLYPSCAQVNEASNTGVISVDLPLERRKDCVVNITVLANQPLLLNIFHKQLYPIKAARCARKDNEKLKIAQDFDVTTSKLLINNVTSDMGKRWQCKIKAGTRDRSCELKIRYRNRNEAVVSVAGRVLSTTQQELMNKYDAIGQYYFNDGESTRFSCDSSAPEKYMKCSILLQHFDSEAILDNYSTNVEARPRTCIRTTLQLRLSLKDIGSYLLCDANGYITKITFHLKPPHVTKSPTFNVTTSFSTTTDVANSIFDDGEKGEEISFMTLVTVGCGTVGIVILVSCLVIAYCIKMKVKQKRDTDATYENFPSSIDSTIPHPGQWEDDTYAEIINHQQLRTDNEPHYQNHLDALYSKPIPKKDRRVNNTVYAEAASQNTAYTQIIHEITTRPVVESGGEPNSVTEMQTPSREDRYCNVFEQATYINAANTTEYVEPAYCCVKTHK